MMSIHRSVLLSPCIVAGIGYTFISKFPDETSKEGSMVSFSIPIRKIKTYLVGKVWIHTWGVSNFNFSLL